MSANSRLTIAVHILTWMAYVDRFRQEPVTSEEIAGSVKTNPVVIRRMLGMLREHGLVSAQRGAHAGWRLTRKPDSIGLLEVYEAVEDEALFSLHHTKPSQRCPIGKGIQPVLARAYEEAHEAMKRALATRSIGTMLKDTLRE